MHDASHYAIFKSEWKNQIVSYLWNLFGGWDSVLWHSHHVVHHHVFTGTRFDPDTRHFYPFLFKSLYPKNKNPKTKYQIIFTLCVLMGFFVYIGQSVAYHIWSIHKRTLWGVPYPKNVKNIWYQYRPLLFLSLLIYLTKIPISSIIWYIIGLNFTYSINILPNHDMMTTLKNSLNRYASKDWGELQVKESGNWGGIIWCHLFGGINYQIEHHLFPSMYHGHYPEISPIVRQTCQEFGIPYNHQPTIIHALYDTFQKMIYINRKKEFTE
jgi:linoleoyl-CoA desaturase